MRQMSIALFLLLFSFAAIAQQPLNFGFEELSVESVNRPWGWAVRSYAANVSFKCDYDASRSGDYGLQIEASAEADTSLFQLSYFVEPSQLLGKTIRLQGFAKANFTIGEAGVLMETYGVVNDEYATLQSVKALIPNGKKKEWQPFDVRFQLGSSLHSISIALFAQGHGTVQFDDLQLSVDGKPVSEVPVAPAFTDEQQRWINENAKPFRTPLPAKSTSPVASELADLDYFKSMTAGAQIIGLGESTHGTSEFFSLKHRLLQYAVLEMGVRVFVLEDNQLFVERINQYVLHGKGKAEKVIKGLFGVWNRAEVLEMIEWVRAYNVDNPAAKVEFVGMDVQNPSLAIDSLHSFLNEKAPKMHRFVTKWHSDFKDGWRNGYAMDDSTLVKWYRSAMRAFRMVESRHPQWLEAAETKVDSMEIEWAVQNARLIVQCIRSLRTGGMEGRDRAMADNVFWILNQRPQVTRMIVWAHDFHVNIGAAPEAGQNYAERKSMGHFLTDEISDRYFACGLFTYRGQARGTVSYMDFTSTTFDIFQSPVGSLDQGLHIASEKYNAPNLMLDLRSMRNSDPAHKWITMKRPVRYMGYVCEDYGFGSRYSIPYQFDAILFVDTTSAARLIVSE